MCLCEACYIRVLRLYMREQKRIRNIHHTLCLSRYCLVHFIMLLLRIPHPGNLVHQAKIDLVHSSTDVSSELPSAIVFVHQWSFISCLYMPGLVLCKVKELKKRTCMSRKLLTLAFCTILLNYNCCVRSLVLFWAFL
jgi:hypothetical protein